MDRFPESCHLRKAVLADIPELEGLISLSVHGLQQTDYTDEQITAALGIIYAVDTQLIQDQTLFVAETETGRIVGCGGWSKRKTLFGGDHSTVREDTLLDPNADAARIRGFFIHPDWARRGLGTLILEACENEALEAGFRRFEMAATLTGVRLYSARGYTVLDRIDAALPGGASLPAIRMVKAAGG